MTSWLETSRQSVTGKTQIKVQHFQIKSLFISCKFNIPGGMTFYAFLGKLENHCSVESAIHLSYNRPIVISYLLQDFHSLSKLLPPPQCLPLVCTTSARSQNEWVFYTEFYYIVSTMYVNTNTHFLSMEITQVKRLLQLQGMPCFNTLNTVLSPQQELFRT